MRKRFRLLDAQIKSVRHSRHKWLDSELKLMKLCWECMDSIGVPKNEEEVKVLRGLIETYDKSIVLIEKDFISKRREYIQ